MGKSHGVMRSQDHGGHGYRSQAMCLLTFLTAHSQLLSYNDSMRYDGVVMIVFIQYSNTYSYNLYQVKYTYRVHVVSNTEFKAEQPVFTKNITTRLIYNRHGVRMIFIQEGMLLLICVCC